MGGGAVQVRVVCGGEDERGGREMEMKVVSG